MSLKGEAVKPSNTFIYLVFLYLAKNRFDDSVVISNKVISYSFSQKFWHFSLNRKWQEDLINTYVLLF